MIYKVTRLGLLFVRYAIFNCVSDVSVFIKTAMFSFFELEFGTPLHVLCYKTGLIRSENVCTVTFNPERL